MLINALGLFACAVSPAVVLGAMVVLPRPYLVILALSSSFAFVLSFILCSLVWTVVPAIRGWLFALVLYSTIIQELGRWGVYWCYVQLQEHIAVMRGIATHSLSSLTSPVDIFGERFACATAMGVGIGATHTLLLTGKLYGDALQPGSVYAEECAMSRHAISALVALAFCALQVIWTVYAFTHAYPSKSNSAVLLIVVSHVVASSLTLLHTANGHPALQCGGVSLPLLYLLLAAFGALAVHTALHGVSKLISSASS